MIRKLSSQTIEADSLVELLSWRALHQPDQQIYTFLVDGEKEEAHLTYGELDQQARRIGAWLQHLGAVGERALLLYPPGLEYIAAFFGCLYAGVIAVPAYPPRLNRPTPRLQAIVADAQASLALTTPSILANIERRFEHTPDLESLHWLVIDDIPAGVETDWQEPSLTNDSLAFLQYTSGSTSTPKGVMLSHGNLIHNLSLIYHGFDIDSESTGVFWLPAYHDMGLIGGILEPMYVARPATLISPIAFLQHPVRWLRAITRYLDWLNLMAYDFHGGWDEVTNFHAPLYASSTEPSPDYLNVDAAVQAYLDAGVPSEKIVLGVPFYGRGWAGVPDRDHGLYQAVSYLPPGTWEAGVFDYRDLAANYVDTDEYTRYWHEQVKAPWLYNPSEGVFIGYEDPESLAFKAEYVLVRNLGGVMFWELSADDGSLLDVLAQHLRSR